jgi:hypothetical protein
MPLVRFLRNFDWKPKPTVTIAFKAGSKLVVTTRCAERAILKGAAEKVERAAFKKMEEGLQEALAVARGDAEPYKSHEPVKRRRRKSSDGEAA